MDVFVGVDAQHHLGPGRIVLSWLDGLRHAGHGHRFPGEADGGGCRRAGWGGQHCDGALFTARPLEKAEPHAGKDWTNTGKNRDKRQLKQRAVGESRTVPCPPELTALLNQHIEQFGTGPDGLLFRGERNGEELPRNTINKAWRRARDEVFTPEVQASPLAATPYDLRHAAVSTWLNGGIPPADVAEWAGHSVEVLLKIYAKCLDGGKHLLRQRVQRALGHGPAA
jgi:hypothetical protein